VAASWVLGFRFLRGGQDIIGRDIRCCRPRSRVIVGVVSIPATDIALCAQRSQVSEISPSAI
jgi:hypothetical protein